MAVKDNLEGTYQYACKYCTFTGKISLNFGLGLKIGDDVPHFSDYRINKCGKCQRQNSFKITEVPREEVVTQTTGFWKEPESLK